MAYKVSISISNFAQGGFYVDTNQDYSSQSEIRTAWIPVPAAPLSVTVLSDYQWSFVAGNNNNFSRLDESFGYKPSGQVIDTSAYSWINSLRIELHSSSLSPPLSPPQSATIELIYENAWYINEYGELTHSALPELPESPMIPPFPYCTWRREWDKNNGFPFNELLPGIIKVNPPNPVEEKPYITIYDKNTKQEEFDSHGLAILCPTRCEVIETINSKWAIDMQHPIDPGDKWRHIQPSYIVKALGQLFTLRKISHTWRGNSGSVQASGDHVFYQQNDGWVFPGARITGQTGLEVLNAINTQTERFAPGITMYDWSYDSDVVVPAGVDYSEWCPTREGATPIEYIMGSNGLIAMTGGELYRDNFYYSVKQRMEGAKDNAFEIRIGKNLKGITRVVDFSSFCVFFRAYDQYGQSFGISWTGEYAYQFVPHTIIRSKNFNTYVDESTLPEGGDIYARSFELLEAEATAFFEANCAPIVSYKVDIEDVKDNPDYKMFANLDDLKVGNTGRLYDERLGVDMGLKISQTKTDAITGKVLEVTFGTVQSFTGGQNYPAVLTDLIPEVVDVELPLRDITGERLYDVNNEPLYEGGEI